MKGNKQSLGDLWNSGKHTNTHKMGIPEGENREKVAECLKNIMALNFPGLVKGMSPNIQKAH